MSMKILQKGKMWVKRVLIGMILLVLMGSLAACDGAQEESAQEPGIIEITAQELIYRIRANPNRYERGTVFRVSGTVISQWEGLTALGPTVDGWRVACGWEAAECKALFMVERGRTVVIQGEYLYTWTHPEPGIISLKNCFFVSYE